MNWPLFQAGIGIDCAGDAFRAVCARRQWDRFRVVDQLEIAGHRDIGPAECGRLYREFLRKHGLAGARTVVSLPRSAALLRSLRFPRAVERELARAVEYQLDSLHPFDEGGVYWDFCAEKAARTTLRETLSGALQESAAGHLDALVAIAEKKAIENTVAWFEEAQIPVWQFSVEAALLISLLWPRLAKSFPGAGAFFLLNRAGDRSELIGYAAGREPFWQELPPASGESDLPGQWPFLNGGEGKRELERARAALRVSPEERPPLVFCEVSPLPDASLPSEDFPFRIVSAEEILPELAANAGAGNAGERLAAFAAAVAAASPSSLFPLNLLPEEKRTVPAPLVHLPTVVLASLVIALAIASAVRGTAQDWLYSVRLEREIQALRPQLTEIERTQEKTQKARERLGLLTEGRNSARLPLEILNELTRLLPSDAWLQQLGYDGETLTLIGTSPAASGLLQTLAQSPYFENPQFRTSIGRTPDGKELFQIGVRLRARIP